MNDNTFEKVYVINLDTRLDRWEAFLRRLPHQWPFAVPERFPGIDGRLVPPPVWWMSGAGAWGCHRTHTRILEDCLRNNVSSVLVCEDDAVFVEDFSASVQVFMQHLPDDWEIVYFGGQHIQQELRLPRKVNDWVYQPFNVNRNHCFGLRGRRAMELYFKHLTNYPDWKLPHHTDHRLGELHRSGPKGLYCPRVWLVGQAEGYSDICRKNLESRLFTGAEEIVFPQIDLTGVAVLGCLGAGTSSVAGLLQHLGINMGSRREETPTQAVCPFEDQLLSHICRLAYVEPWLFEAAPAIDRINHLRHWAGLQCQNCRTQSQFFGGKHANLSLMGPELIEAWNDPFFICVDRPAIDCYNTAVQAGVLWHPNAIKQAIDLQQKTRENFLEVYSPRFLRVSWRRMVQYPENVVQEVCDLLGYVPTESHYTQAIAFIKESSKHWLL
ncbi:MAG: glycosyltransferase family 25 protein [Thermoguttaceae bacterium]